MRIFLMIFISVVFISNIHASCTSNGLSVIPEGKTIRPNTVFIVEGYAQSQEIVKQLNKGYPIYLISGRHKVRLKVKEILTGQYLLNQAVLVPEKELKPDSDYQLVIENLPLEESVTRWNPELKKHEPLVYTIVQESDTVPPVFTNPPGELNKSLDYYGCGPSSYVVFSCNIADSSECYVRATVKNAQTNEKTTFYVRPYKGSVSIGYSMCSGAFKFDEGDLYEIEFALMDASGNCTDWTGDPIQFTKPTAGNGQKIKDE